MEDWQAEVLAMYARINYVLSSNVSAIVNMYSKEAGLKELEELKKVLAMIEMD